MQKKTQGWEPNTERLFARDEMLIGNNFMALKLEEVVIIPLNSYLPTSTISQLPCNPLRKKADRKWRSVFVI